MSFYRKCLLSSYEEENPVVGTAIIVHVNKKNIATLLRNRVAMFFIYPWR